MSPDDGSWKAVSALRGLGCAQAAEVRPDLLQRREHGGDGVVYALKRFTGAVRWQVDLNEELSPAFNYSRRS